MYSDSSFFAKMVLLFALVFLGHPAKRKGLESYVKGFFNRDSSAIIRIPSARMASSANIQSSIPR